MPGEPDEAPTGARLAELLGAVGEAGPLVQHLTNEVTMSETANVTLHWGGLPVMADAPAEAAEMAAGADAVLINTGRATEAEVDAMIEAGAAANESGAAVVLDPVGYGATEHRVESVGRLLDAVAFDAIKGNRGEISGLAGNAADVRGVEAVGDYDEVAGSARALAEETGAAVVASGETDVVAGPDGAVVEAAVGHPMMGAFVGSGCTLGSTAATFAAVAGGFEAALYATLAFGLAGERAAEADLGDAGPASYRTAFFDAVAAMADERPAVDDLGGRVTRP